MKQSSSLRDRVPRNRVKFDTTTLPADMQRVYKSLKKLRGEEYALVFVFIMRTGMELHRAWHMTLLTSKILQQIKEAFDIRMTWDIGVFKLKFRIEEGLHEIHRKCPYDYDSEYQDMYMRIAMALCQHQITVQEALVYQTEAKAGKHTAKSGLFLRDFPGRLLLYPLLAMTCAVIFFGGDWTDGGIAALCGFATGVLEYFLSEGVGGEAKVLIDILVGTLTGVIGSLFYRYQGQEACLSSIFLGTLYWFFYGTAFVLGLLEIIAGELETGVTRFIAVSVKTFVLCLGAGFGMLLTLENASDAWQHQAENCGTIDLGEQTWRIPLYLLCSAAALGQYRFPVIGYWRGLLVQLAGYEVQYQLQVFLEKTQGHDLNNLDTAMSNVGGAAASVCAACLISWVLDQMRYYYYGRLLAREDTQTTGFFADLSFYFVAATTSVVNSIGLARQADVDAQNMSTKIQKQQTEIQDPHHERTQLELTPNEEHMVVGIVIDAQDHNIWAVLMPAVYQLVPGSMIAKLWFNSIFPPPLLEEEHIIPLPDGSNITIPYFQVDSAQDNIFSNLMVIATSLALGLMMGFALVAFFEAVFCGCCSDTVTDIYGGGNSNEKVERALNLKKNIRTGMYTADDDDPTDGDEDNKEESGGNGEAVEKPKEGEKEEEEVSESSA